MLRRLVTVFTPRRRSRRRIRGHCGIISKLLSSASVAYFSLRPMGNSQDLLAFLSEYSVSSVISVPGRIMNDSSN